MRINQSSLRVFIVGVFYVLTTSNASDVCNNGSVVTDGSVINSPNYPLPYENGVSCSYQIRAPPGKIVLLVFSDVDIEQVFGCHYDALFVFDGLTTDDTLLGWTCGQSIIPAAFNSSDRDMLLLFESDVSVSGRGFAATVNYLFPSQYPGTPYQNVTITTDGAPIFSPNFPSSYGASLNCFYNVMSPPGTTIALNITRMSVETHSSCAFDRMVVYNGNSVASPILITLCGTGVPDPIYSSSNLMTIQFITDSTVPGAGFEGGVNFIGGTVSDGTDRAYREDGRCGGDYLAPSGDVAECNPNGPAPCCSPYNWCGYTADHCDCEGCIDYRDYDICEYSPCFNGGSCQLSDTNNDGYTCLCSPRGRGRNCEFEIEDAGCSSNGCRNQGTCVTLEDGFQFCSCRSAYTGLRCEIRKNNIQNECRSGSDPCGPNGECVNVWDEFYCSCAIGYTGEICEIEIGSPEDPCSHVTCSNYGHCLMLGGEPACLCHESDPGLVCEVEIDYCVQVDPCVNGQCYVTTVSPGYICVCQGGWSGDTCETAIGTVNACSSSPCLNGASCYIPPSGAGYSCICMDGYTGTRCDQAVGTGNACSSSPCRNGASCTNVQSGYMCTCTTGYTGTRCGQDINECINNPCYHGLDCVNRDGSFQCNCGSSYTGPLCETDVNECEESTPCRHGGTCTNTVGGFYCTCPPAWTGTTCRSDVDECIDTPCRNGGTCTNTKGSFQCACPQTYTGILCETDVDECAVTTTCRNGGSCRNTNGGFYCLCPPTFTGTLCGVDVDECAHTPCHNGGVCTNTKGGFYCTCLSTYAGDLCETAVSPCTDSINPCINGECVTSSTGNLLCVCQTGWQGTFCDEIESPCHSAPCLNGGTCLVLSETQFTCRCPVQFSGTLCQNDSPNPCSLSPCLNNGQCLYLAEETVCVCLDKFDGDYCEIDLQNPCSSNPCLNAGSCLQSTSGGSYSCACPDGYSGSFCEVDEANPCSHNPCENGGSCLLNGASAFFCVCPSNYIGNRCEIDTTSPCYSSPCENGGTCRTLLVAMPFCICQEGYSGINCEQRVSTCGDTNPCLNGGECTSFESDIVCKCQPGWKGRLCDEDVDECEAYSPCGPNAICGNNVGSFRCLCSRGYSGEDCSEEDEAGETAPPLTGTVIGGIAGIILLLIFIVLLIFLMQCARRRPKASNPPAPVSNPAFSGEVPSAPPHTNGTGFRHKDQPPAYAPYLPPSDDQLYQDLQPAPANILAAKGRDQTPYQHYLEPKDKNYKALRVPKSPPADMNDYEQPMGQGTRPASRPPLPSSPPPEYMYIQDGAPRDRITSTSMYLDPSRGFDVYEDTSGSLKN